MTTPKDKFEPQESPTPLSPLSDAPDDYMNYGRRPTSDPLAVLGIGSAVIAFLFWAIPAPVCWDYYGERLCLQEYFSFERLPAIAGFLVLSLILLIARAGNRR